jgi:hypothetical protein
LKEDVAAKVKRSTEEYDTARSGSQRDAREVDMNMMVRFVDGDELIVDSFEEGGLVKASPL